MQSHHQNNIYDIHTTFASCFPNKQNHKEKTSSFSYFYCLSHIPRFMKIKSQSRFIEYRFRYHLFISITYYITYHNIIIFSTFHKHIHIQICNIVHNAHFRNTIVLHAKTIVPLSRSEVADNSIRPLHSQADQEVPYEF